LTRLRNEKGKDEGLNTSRASNQQGEKREREREREKSGTARDITRMKSKGGRGTWRVKRRKRKGGREREHRTNEQPETRRERPRKKI